MKFKFTIQSYQTEAVDSVVGVFAGQPFNDRFTYRRDISGKEDYVLFSDDDDLLMGFANSRVLLNSVQLTENIRRIQRRNNIVQENIVLDDGLGVCSLDVEMETGTGKTYVYIKTMFELHKQYGWSKYIVVVPSIAICEGVQKSFETLQEHFMQHYGKKARFFVYDSKNLAQIDNFSQSADLNVMIINIQAFNVRSKDARRIRTELDDFGSRRPIDVIKANRPIVILDEPQKMGGSATQESLKDFNPLFCLNYSATHKNHHTLVYVLDALDAYNKRLVKQIVVKGFDIRNLPGTGSYLFLEDIVLGSNKPPLARLQLEIRRASGPKRDTRLVGVDDDLFVLSNSMEQYRGFHVSGIDPDAKTLSFTNGKCIRAGEVIGDVSEMNVRRVQIRETIRSHFAKEKELFEKGIKCLSLFFIDKVENYRKYDKDGNEVNSEYAAIFEQEYVHALNEALTLCNAPYEQYLRSIDVHATHAGYFSIDKKGRKVDSALKRGSDISDDISAYDLILKDKERLLSFSNPVRFIFSHSALREGWDNPNVFQICTLKHGGASSTQKRQEVGRGLRLCVNQNGERMDAVTLGNAVFNVNQLTVIASDGYKKFVENLQQDIREDLYERPAKASEQYFIGKTLMLNGQDVTISEQQGKDIYRYLIENAYVDKDYHIAEKYRTDKENGTLAALPESCRHITEGVHALIQNIFDPHVLDNMIKDGRETKITENPLNGNFYKKEFQKLWSLINHKFAYTVSFDSDELIAKAIAHVDDNMLVTKLQYTVTTGQQTAVWDAGQLKEGRGFEAAKSRTETLKHAPGCQLRYDLIGKVAEGTKLTRATVAKILSGLKPSTFSMFRENPEEFITKAVRLINEQKATMIVEQISYNRTEGTYDGAIFTAENNGDFSKAYKAQKNVQDYVFTDGYAANGNSVERRLAAEMDRAEEVKVYAKLPRGFSIPTPVGTYSPDWAIVFDKNKVKHIFFIAETKGTLETLQLRPIEQAKINCAKKLFASMSADDIVYHDVDSYQTLLGIMEKL